MNNGWTPERKSRQAAMIQGWKPWKKSTGPRSKEGKIRSSLNAYKNNNKTDLNKVIAQLHQLLGRQKQLLKP